MEDDSGVESSQSYKNKYIRYDWIWPEDNYAADITTKKAVATIDKTNSNTIVL